jgi:hypothetical protein
MASWNFWPGNGKSCLVEHIKINEEGGINTMMPCYAFLDIPYFYLEL